MFYIEIEFTKDPTYFGYPDLYLYEINFATKKLTLGTHLDESPEGNNVIDCYKYDSDKIFGHSVSYRSEYWAIKI